MPICAALDCFTVSRGTLCPRHYFRFRRHGDITVVKRAGRKPFSQSVQESRFWDRVNKTDTCWLWTGYVKTNGYGQLKVNRKNFHAHRFCYELCKGAIPAEMELDHLCRVRHCVRPEHLEPVPRAVNMQRAAAARRAIKLRQEVHGK